MAVPNVVEKVNPSTGLAEQFRVIEIAVDPPNTIIRKLVPIDTEEEDVPVGARLMNPSESKGIIERQSAPDNILVGDRVRLRAAQSENNPVDGTVEAKLKGGKFRVRWADGGVDRYEIKELIKVY